MIDGHAAKFIIELYRYSRAGPFASFQTRALELLKGVVPFESAWWGNASRDTMQIHRIHLFNCAESIIDDYPAYMEEDVFRIAMIDNPDKTINMDDLVPRAEWVKTRLYREYATKYKVQAAIGTLVIDPITSLFEFVTIWRHDYRPFTPEECAAKELVMPHMVGAHRLSRLYHVMAREAQIQARHWAIADPSGHLRELMPGFAQLLREEWPEWTASKLPGDLDKTVSQAGTYRGQRLVVRVRPYEHLRFVEARMLTAIDRLSAREMEVARHYSAGQTYNEIAVKLGIAPSTVRNLIARCFNKLAVSNKAELVRRLAEAH